MDQINYTNQFCPPQIQTLRDDMVIAGRAFPVVEMDMDDTMDSKRKYRPFGLILRALDDLKKANDENRVRKAIESGMEACDAFHTYGVM